MPIEDGRLDHVELIEDPFLMAAAVTDERVRMVPFIPGDLEPERLLLLEEGHCLRDQALAVCKMGQQGQRNDCSATSLATLLRLVSHGMGQTLIPMIAVPGETARTDIQIVPFDDPVPSRRLALFFRRATPARDDMVMIAGLIAEAAESVLAAAREVPALAWQERRA